MSALKCFGVGDGKPSAERNHSSYLYEFGGVSLLIDCGEPISRSYKASGLGYDLIDRIFISHLHFDHLGGFFMLMQSFWLENRRKDLVVHLPRDGIHPLRQMLEAACLFDELLPFRLKFESLQSGQPVTHGPVRVIPCPTSHLESFRLAFAEKHPGDFAAFSFLLETDRLRIAHSADLGQVADLEPLLIQPLDLLVCELAHFKPEELFAFLKGRAIQEIAFTHLGRSCWERLEETRRLAATSLPGIKLHFPKDQEVITL